MEERNNQIGYLTAKVERLEHAVDELKRVNIQQDSENAKYNKKISDKLDKALDQLAMYRHFTVFIRAVLIGIIMIVTLKFGDMVSWIKEVFDAT